MLSPVQLFYLEHNSDQAPEALAEALGAPLKAVKAALKKVKAAQAKMAQVAAPPKATQRGPQRAAVMTAEEAERTSRRNRAKIPAKLSKDISVVDPSQPIY